MYQDQYQAISKLKWSQSAARIDVVPVLKILFYTHGLFYRHLHLNTLICIDSEALSGILHIIKCFLMFLVNLFLCVLIFLAGH